MVKNAPYINSNLYVFYVWINIQNLGSIFEVHIILNYFFPFFTFGSYFVEILTIAEHLFCEF